MSKYGRRAQAGGASVRDTVHPYILSGGWPCVFKPQENLSRFPNQYGANTQETGTATGSLCRTRSMSCPYGSLIPIWKMYVRLPAFGAYTLLPYPIHPN